MKKIMYIPLLALFTILLTGCNAKPDGTTQTDFGVQSANQGGNKGKGKAKGNPNAGLDVEVIGSENAENEKTPDDSTNSDSLEDITEDLFGDDKGIDDSQENAGGDIPLPTGGSTIDDTTPVPNQGETEEKSNEDTAEEESNDDATEESEEANVGGKGKSASKRKKGNADSNTGSDMDGEGNDTNEESISKGKKPNASGKRGPGKLQGKGPSKAEVLTKLQELSELINSMVIEEEQVEADM